MDLEMCVVTLTGTQRNGCDLRGAYGIWHVISHFQGYHIQWRCQDLLREGAKLLILSWGTHGGFQGRVQQRLDDY